MPTRATKRGLERTPLDRDCDVLICGASFAGLAVARELAGTGADVMMIDRYEIGERQTSACGIPTTWLTALHLEEALQQTFPELVIHTPHATVRYDLPWTFSTFDYRTLCGLLAAQGSFSFETAKVERREGSDAVVTDRGTIRAGLIVDALGWRRVLGAGANVQPPDALLSRGLEVHPFGGGAELEVWIDRGYVPMHQTVYPGNRPDLKESFNLGIGDRFRQQIEHAPNLHLHLAQNKNRSPNLPITSPRAADSRPDTSLMIGCRPSRNGNHRLNP